MKTMKRAAIVLAMILGLSPSLYPQTQQGDFLEFSSEDGAVTFIVDGDRDMTVIVPHISKNDLVNIVADYLAKDDALRESQLKAVFKKAGNLTMILTTKESDTKSK